jgi:hypothetical protein
VGLDTRIKSGFASETKIGHQELIVFALKFNIFLLLFKPSLCKKIDEGKFIFVITAA